MTRAFIFPGQGSQFVGMGKDVAEAFAEAREVFEEVDDVLGEKLSQIIFEGPEDSLMLTANTQPALMATSIAILRVLEKQGGVDVSSYCRFVAGHSLGEYSALCAAKSFSLADTARLLSVRGNAMQEAVPEGQGGMAALIGVDFDTAEKIAKKSINGDVCQAANDNGGGQVVVSGSMAAIDRVVALAPEYGAKRAVKLPVSAPFHSELMASAAKVMEGALASVEVSPPVVPLIANVTADEVVDVQEIRRLLVQQVTGMVRWRESVMLLRKKGVEHCIEIGAGKVLSGLCRRIDKELSTTSIQNVDDIDAFLNQL